RSDRKTSRAASVGLLAREHRNYFVSGSKVNVQRAHAELPRIGIIALGDQREQLRLERLLDARQSLLGLCETLSPHLLLLGKPLHPKFRWAWLCLVPLAIFLADHFVHRGCAAVLGRKFHSDQMSRRHWVGGEPVRHSHICRQLDNRQVIVLADWKSDLLPYPVVKIILVLADAFQRGWRDQLLNRGGIFQVHGVGHLARQFL